MTQSEKDALVSLFLLPSAWCKEAEARDSNGEAVPYSDTTAVAWDVTGGVCRLFGWDRAQELFAQLVRLFLNRQTSGRGPNAAIRDMVALQEFNDHPNTTHDVLLAGLRTAPVWSRGATRHPTAPQTDPLSEAEVPATSDVDLPEPL